MRTVAKNLGIKGWNGKQSRDRLESETSKESKHSMSENEMKKKEKYWKKMKYPINLIKNSIRFDRISTPLKISRIPYCKNAIKQVSKPYLNAPLSTQNDNTIPMRMRSNRQAKLEDGSFLDKVETSSINNFFFSEVAYDIFTDVLTPKSSFKSESETNNSFSAEVIVKLNLEADHKLESKTLGNQNELNQVDCKLESKMTDERNEINQTEIFSSRSSEGNLVTMLGISASETREIELPQECGTPSKKVDNYTAWKNDEEVDNRLENEKFALRDDSKKSVESNLPIHRYGFGYLSHIRDKAQSITDDTKRSRPIEFQSKNDSGVFGVLSSSECETVISDDYISDDDVNSHEVMHFISITQEKINCKDQAECKQKSRNPAIYKGILKNKSTHPALPIQAAIAIDKEVPIPLAKDPRKKIEHFYSNVEFKSSGSSLDHSPPGDIHDFIYESKQIEIEQLNMNENERIAEVKPESESKENELKKKKVRFSSLSDELIFFFSYSSDLSPCTSFLCDAIPKNKIDVKHDDFKRDALISSIEFNDVTLASASNEYEYSTFGWLINFMCMDSFWDYLDNV